MTVPKWIGPEVGVPRGLPQGKLNQSHENVSSCFGKSASSTCADPCRPCSGLGPLGGPLVTEVFVTMIGAFATRGVPMQFACCPLQSASAASLSCEVILAESYGRGKAVKLKKDQDMGRSQ